MRLLARCIAIGVPVLLAGCASEQVRFSTVRQASKVPDVYEEQVLKNMARLAANPASLPFFTLLDQGTTSVTDRGSAAFSATAVPHKFTSWAIGNFSTSRDVQENFTSTPLREPERLAAMRCAYQLVVSPDAANGAESQSLLAHYLASQPIDYRPVLACGWVHVGCRRDVPKDACHVAHSGGTYVWVDPRGEEAFTRFTLLILNIATLKTEKPAGPLVVELHSPHGAVGAGPLPPMPPPGTVSPFLVPGTTPPRREPSGFNPGLLLVPRP